jgi:hypothetical protein
VAVLAADHRPLAANFANSRHMSPELNVRKPSILTSAVCADQALRELSTPLPFFATSSAVIQRGHTTSPCVEPFWPTERLKPQSFERMV